MSIGQSTFLNWAKTRPKLKYDLAVSGVLNLPFDEFNIPRGELELHGDNSYGYRPLVNAIAAHCQVNPENVVTVSGGTSMANHLAMASLIRPDDEILIEHPTYEPIIAVAEYLGARVSRFHRSLEKDYIVDPDEIARHLTPETRLIALTNLHNPSSVVADAETLGKVGNLARTTGAQVLVDEVYLESMFAKKPKSSVFLGPEFVATSSLTKGFGLSGLRCGWILAEPALAERMRRLNDIFGAVAPNITERLSVFALGQLSRMTVRAQKVLQTNRRKLNDFFDTRDDLDVVRTEFGTTSFPRVRKGQVDKLCKLLQEKYETAVVPGHFFDAPDHIRVGVCCEPNGFARGLENLGQALDLL